MGLFGCTLTSLLHLHYELFCCLRYSFGCCLRRSPNFAQDCEEGPQTGPLTPLVGNLVQTPKGLRPIDLEGFSEDLDQDGFVDPIAPAAPAPVVAPLPAPVVRTVPVQAP